MSESTTEQMIELARTSLENEDLALVDDFRRAVVALESTLARELPEDALLAMVEGDANTSLDDPTDAAARAWLEAILVRLRAVLGAAARA